MHRGVARGRCGSVVSIPRALTHGRELVVLTREEYERKVLRSQEIAGALRIIAEGEREYQEGRTLKADSLSDALKLHASRSR